MFVGSDSDCHLPLGTTTTTTVVSCFSVLSSLIAIIILPWSLLSFSQSHWGWKFARLSVVFLILFYKAITSGFGTRGLQLQVARMGMWTFMNNVWRRLSITRRPYHVAFPLQYCTVYKLVVFGYHQSLPSCGLLTFSLSSLSSLSLSLLFDAFPLAAHCTKSSRQNNNIIIMYGNGRSLGNSRHWQYYCLLLSVIRKMYVTTLSSSSSSSSSSCPFCSLHLCNSK
jgi:hypothetical protein